MEPKQAGRGIYLRRKDRLHEGGLDMISGRKSVFLSTLVVGLLLLLSVPFAVQGADRFATPAFEEQWNSVEGTIPNFWGPLKTAREGQTERYAEGVYNGEPGKRLVQYFDKARMEQTNPQRPVTNGLLTVELKTGQVQLGDVSFERRDQAFIEIAGDQDAPGPSYATLNDPSLPERVAQRGGSVDRGYDMASKTFIRVPPATDPELAFVTYQGDPGGRFGQNVPKAFWDYLNAIPGGWLTTMGYPIGEAFGTQVQVNGQVTFVVVQAFERRVLTYTPTNPVRFRVEFGNIGRHYYRWRYERPRPVTDTATPTVMPTATMTATPTKAPTATPTMTPTATAMSGVTFTRVQGAKPGNVATATVQTAPAAPCTIGYVTPRGTQSEAAGLVPKTADAGGKVSWSWLIGGNTTPGTGTVTVTCNGVSASSPITIG
jgi:hypothetical protein